MAPPFTQALRASPTSQRDINNASGMSPKYTIKHGGLSALREEQESQLNIFNVLNKQVETDYKKQKREMVLANSFGLGNKFLFDKKRKSLPPA